MIRILVIAVAVLSLLGCATRPSHPALSDADLPRLLPVRDLVANVHYRGDYRISPDGTRLAWRQVHGLREQVFVRTLGRDDTRKLGFDAQGIPMFWAQDSRRLLLIKDAGGDENFHLYVADTDHPDRPLRDLTPLANTRVLVQQIIADDPGHILILHNARDRALFDLYRLDLDSGEQTLLHRNPGDVQRVITDRQGRLRARIRRVAADQLLELPGSAGGWTERLRWSPDDELLPLGFDAGGDGLWALSNRGRDKRALVRVDLAGGGERVIYRHPDADVGRVYLSHRSQVPALAYVHTDYTRVIRLDPALPKLATLVPGKGPRRIRLTSIDDAEQRLVLAVDTDRGTTDYLYDGSSGQVTRLGSSPSLAFAADLADMRPVQLRARDGLALHGYLTLPRGSAGQGLPMVLLVHGGPFTRDLWGYNRRVQFLANRGYAVLQINYRGSSGYGRAFTEAAYGEFAGSMQDDLIDAVRWAVEQGIADPARVAIVGRSYGGYAALVGLTRDPDTFACGIAIVPPSDLVGLSEAFPPYWRPFMHRWRRAVGDPADPADRARMAAQSPINHAERVRAPVLIVQGANDVRVTRDQAEGMVAALRAAGKPVDYLLIPDEGHRIRHWKNRLKLYRASEDFLAGCLGGRSAGFDYYQLGSWLF